MPTVVSPAGQKLLLCKSVLTQSCLVAPVNLSALSPGALLNAGKFALRPYLHGSETLFVSSLDGLLRLETLTGEVLSDVAHLPFTVKVLFYRLTHCRPAQQAVKVHLEPHGALVDDHALDRCLFDTKRMRLSQLARPRTAGLVSTPSVSVK